MPAAPGPAADSARIGRGGAAAWRRAAPGLATLPFFAYVAVFLLVPTVIVIVGAFQDSAGGFTVATVGQLFSASALSAFGLSIALSALTALIGAVIGGVLAYALSTSAASSMMRRLVSAACSVLAQFGGVLLAFAFIATVGTTGTVTKLLESWFGISSTGQWLYGFGGLTLVYTYFQIPLMVLVFLPAVEGLRPQWREASETLGGSTWAYWRHVGGPLLAPAFLGSALLLFANAFSAYATAAALITQYNTLVTLQIRGAMISEINLGQENLAKILALGMVVVVAAVMALYSWLARRTSRWLG